MSPEGLLHSISMSQKSPNPQNNCLLRQGPCGKDMSRNTPHLTVFISIASRYSLTMFILKLCLYQYKFVICYHKVITHFDLEKYFKNHKPQKHEVKGPVSSLLLYE